MLFSRSCESNTKVYSNEKAYTHAGAAYSRRKPSVTYYYDYTNIIRTFLGVYGIQNVFLLKGLVQVLCVVFNYSDFMLGPVCFVC